MAFPTLLLEIAFTSQPLVGSPTWTAISETKLRSVKVSRGRTSELDQFSAGTMEVVLDNRDRLFDPLYTSGTYYGNLKPNKQIRLRVTHNAVTYPIFRGFVDGFPQDYELGGDQTVTVRATDAFKILSRTQMFGTFPFAQQLTGARVVAILGTSKVNWPAALRVISSGSSIVVAEDVSTITALEALLEVDRTEQGRLFVDRSGNVTFVSRQDLQTTSTYTSSQMTFGDSGTETPYSEVSFDHGDTLIRNDIEVTHPTYASATASDATSQADYGTQSHSVESIDASPAAMQSMADQLLALYKDPHARVPKVTVPLHKTDSTFTNGQYATCLGSTIDLASRVTLKRRPTGGGNVISSDFWIDHIDHDISPQKTWDMSFQLGISQDAQGYGTWDSGVWDTARWGW